MRGAPMDTWNSGDKYAGYMGRWSALVARRFIAWLEPASGLSWLEVGCGTGALTRTILEDTSPAQVLATDPSAEFLDYAEETLDDTRVTFRVAGATQLPAADREYDAIVSGLVLNFVPDASFAAGEMRRTARLDGTVAAYVWDYAEGMQMMRHFWDAATAQDPSAIDLDEGRRFSICSPDSLRMVFESVGLRDVEVQAIEFEMRFSDFDDFWQPFLFGQGPAGAYVVALADDRRERLARHLRSTLPFAGDGSIPLTARAWAVRGMR